MFRQSSHKCSHITRKRRVYYYRRRVPCLSGGEVAVSLRTRNYREAEHRAGRLDAVFRRAVATMQDRSALTIILRDRLRQQIGDDEAQWLRTAPGRPAYTWVDDDEDPVKADIEATEGWLVEARIDARGRHFTGYEEAADAIIAEHGLSVADRSEVLLGLAQARIAMLEARLRRLRGNGPEILGAAPPIIDNAQPPSSIVAIQPTIEPETSGPLLSEVLPSALDFLSKEEAWRGQTLAQNSTTYRMFIQHCGDRRVRSYSKRDLTGFYDVLRGLPALYSKKPAWRGLTLAEIVQRTKGEDVERLAMKTVKRHFSALGRLFTYFKKRGEFEGENPAHGFEFPLKGRANAGRKIWSSDKLAKLFSSPVFAGCLSEGRRSTPGEHVIRDERYWLPILGLYHGNRLEEFAQLRREDVKREQAIWYFNITDEGERQLKNEQSRRRVPIHPSVLRLGFIEYIEQVAPQPHSLVFPRLRPGGPDKKLGFNFTKWFSRYRQEIGLYEKGMDYHSFRHGATTKLYEAGVSEAYIDELTGHEGQGTSRKVYKKQMPLPVLLEAISKVDWPEVVLTPATLSPLNSVLAL